MTNYMCCDVLWALVPSRYPRVYLYKWYIKVNIKKKYLFELACNIVHIYDVIYYVKIKYIKLKYEY